MNKAFENFTWQNEPKVDTPLSADNLNKVNRAVNEIDNRVITLNTAKANVTDIQKSLVNVTFEESTGVLRFTHKDGSSIRIDTKLEKIPFEYEFDSETQQLVITNTDGTTQSIDISSFITILEFLASDTITPVIDENKVKFEIVKGSVSDEYIEPNYLAKLKVEASRSEIASASALDSAKRAEDAAGKAQTIAKFEIDTVLDENSYNPISNRPVTLELKKKVESIPAVDFKEAKKPEFIQSAQELVKSVNEMRNDLVATNDQVFLQGKAIKQNTEALDNRIKKFYTSNLGETHIADSDDGAFRNIVIGGKSEQFTTTGAQLIVPVNKRTIERNGVTITYDNGIVTMNGTAQETLGYGLVDLAGGFLPPLEANTTYCLSTEPRNTYEQGKTYVHYWNNSLGMVGLTKSNGYGVFETNTTGTGETSANIAVYVENGVTYNNYSFSVQFEKASTPSPHEPYTGGQPSPSPDYPQPIESVDNATVKDTGKNILDLRNGRSATNAGVTYTRNEDSSYKRTGTATDKYGNVWFLGRYSEEPNSDGDNVLFTLQPNKSYFIRDCQLYTKVNGTNHEIASGQIYTVNANAFRDGFKVTGVRNPPHEVNKTYNDTVYPMVVEVASGNSDIPWQPYTEQLAPIPFTLRSVGEGENAVRDVMYVYADGTGKLVQRIGVKRITTCVYYNTSYNLAYFTLGYYPIRNKTFKALATHFIYEENIYSNARDWTFNVQTHNSADWSDYARALVRFPSELFTTASEVTNWLADKEIYFLYPLYEPIETTLIAEQVKALFDLCTHYGGTHISFESENGVEPTFYGDYPCALENFVEYVKQQMGDDRKFIYDMEDRLTNSEYMSALAYVNSEYATALTELGV